MVQIPTTQDTALLTRLSVVSRGTQKVLTKHSQGTHKALTRVGLVTQVRTHKVLTGVWVGVEVAPRVLAQPVVRGGVEVAGGHVASHLRILILLD